MASLISKAKSKFHEHTDKDATQGQSKVDTGPTQPAQPSNTDAGDSASETTAALDVHNEARTAKGAPPMEWDPSLAQEAEAYAQKLATKNIMEHSDVSGQGENLYMSSGNASFSDAVQNWLDEEKHYSGEKVGEGDFGKWGHFCKSRPGNPLRGHFVGSALGRKRVSAVRLRATCNIALSEVATPRAARAHHSGTAASPL